MRIYLDNNATTPMLPAVWEAMRPYFIDVPGNPASSHRDGQKARQALEDARERTAALLGAHADEVIFTSGATEANNLAIFGLSSSAGHVISSGIEHPSVVEPIHKLVQHGLQYSNLPVNREGVVDPDALARFVRPDTCLVAVMLANHETGAIQPVDKLTCQLQDRVALHCDAAAGAGKIKIDFRSLGASSLTISGHKFHGPKGVGALLVRRGTKLRAQLFGGHQQQGRRPGTEPVALVVGMATALDLTMTELDDRTENVRALRQRFLDGLRRWAEPIAVNGSASDGIPHTINVSFPGCRADVLLMKLDLAGISCSTGSACSSGSLLPSPVLKAMGVEDAILHSAMRFSLSHLLTQTQVDEASARIGQAVNQLRSAIQP